MNLSKKILILLSVLLLVPLAGCRNAEPEPEVRNLILMIGDGMGLAHVSALMIENEYAPINMERCQVGGFVKTYSANNRVTDSGASGTAYAAGVKTNNSYLGVDVNRNEVESIADKAVEAGLGTGLVATIYIQHATPAAFYGHTPHRSDSREISLDLLDSGIDVAIGGGMRYLRSENRKDGRDLVGEFREKGYFMTDSLGGLDSVTEGKAMALVEKTIPLITGGRDPGYLPGATAKALEILTNNSRDSGNGFFLMVEGSLIDYTCHDHDTEAMLAEVRDFDNAVGVALDYAETHPGTLVIVLADHETGGLSIPSGNTDFLRAESGIEFNWGSRGHTGSMVPMFVYGSRAADFGGVLDNDEVGRRMQQALGLQ